MSLPRTTSPPQFLLPPLPACILIIDVKPCHCSGGQFTVCHRGDPGPIPGQFMRVHKVVLGQVSFRVLRSSPVIIIPPILLIGKTYEKDERAKAGNLPKSNGFSEAGKH